MTNPLKERITELCEMSKAEHPDLDDWFILLNVESYIRKEEPELLVYMEEEEDTENGVNKPDIVIIETDSITELKNETDR